MEQDSSFSSIVPTYPGEVPWHRLHETESLAILHANFWATSTKEPEDESMNVDAVDDEDTGSGCYILDLRIPGIDSKVWIRKEYIRLYDYCDEYLKSKSANKEPISVVITGQPGIGKSYWILYAMHRRLSEGKPVFWYHDSRRYLFVKEGVYEVPEHFPSTTFKTLVWTLVDSDESLSGVPSNLAVHCTKHFIIFTTPPQSSQWKPLEKTTGCRVAIMNPWTRAEIAQAAVIHGLTADDNAGIDKMYYQYGPTPRICFDFFQNKALLVAHKSRYKNALKNLSLKKLGEMVMGNSAQHGCRITHPHPCEAHAKEGSHQRRPGYQQCYRFCLRKRGADHT